MTDLLVAVVGYAAFSSAFVFASGAFGHRVLSISSTEAVHASLAAVVAFPLLLAGLALAIGMLGAWA